MRTPVPYGAKPAGRDAHAARRRGKRGRGLRGQAGPFLDASGTWYLREEGNVQTHSGGNAEEAAAILELPLTAP